MKRRTLALIAAAGMVALSPALSAQTFQLTGTTTINVVVAAEASLYINDSSTTLSGGPLFTDYTGTTRFTYKIRTTQGSGSGSITSLVTSDFAPGGGPSVASPPTTGDALTYTCSVSSPANPCSGTQTASTTVAQPVASFTADGRSARDGNSGQISWTLTNDPQYKTGSYSATVTFTVSAT
jgi:hypothetical protein